MSNPNSASPVNVSPQAAPLNRDGAITGAAPKKSRAGIAGLPVGLLFSLCGLGALFLMASAIVLSLIPLYLPTKNIGTVSTSEQVTQAIPIEKNTVVDNGPLNDNQKAILKQDLTSQIAANTGVNPDITIQSAVAQTNPTSGRKRSAGKAGYVLTVFLINFSRVSKSKKKSVLKFLKTYIIPIKTATKIQLASTTVTKPTTTTKAPNGTRILSRRSIDEGGAPAGMVYIDTHKIAGMTGNATSISFYVDQSCASATIEFGAFELEKRDISTNTAELALKQRSGPIIIDDRRHLRPYMSLVTFRLCTGDSNEDAHGEECKGKVFPVLAHQYIGVRTDSCRLGYADPPENRVFSTTWKLASNQMDPFVDSTQRAQYVPSEYVILQTVKIESKVSDKSSEEITHEVGTASEGPRVLFIGSYTPRRCGLAKYLEDLTNVYPGRFGVVAVDEETSVSGTRVYSDKVVYRLKYNDRDSYYRLAEIFNHEPYDIVNIQHEYGLYGGMASEYILAFMAAVRKPIVITMHTIIPEPSTIYISITRAVCSLSTRVVVMSELGRHLLVNLYGVDESKIVVLPHGVPDVPFLTTLAEPKSELEFSPQSPIISTFGLLHRNKNIEFALKALKNVATTVPNVLYLVIGQTHPGIQIYEGETYRSELVAMVNKLGLQNNVKFINRFLNDSELIRYLMASDVYLTPYAREDQYVSGTLSWAVGMGKAVVSTPYMYAKELLADGRGFLVPFEDEESLSSILTTIIQKTDIRETARHKAYNFGRHMTWTRVTKQLSVLFRDLVLYS